MNTKWLDDLWYALYKDYGTEIVYTKIGKAAVNYESGQREDVKLSFQIPAVCAPVTLYQEYLEKLAGKEGRPDRVDRAKTRFLVKKNDLQVEIESADYFVYLDKRYMNVVADDLLILYVLSGVATPGARPYRVINLTTNDQLGLGDGV
jgi:hypothetical protein